MTVGDDGGPTSDAAGHAPAGEGPAGHAPAGHAPAEHAPAGDARTLVRLEAVVRGRVQGVGFRYWVLKRSTGLGVTGWVANEADGSVRVVAEGDASSLDELEALLGRGPVGSIVETVQAVRMPATNGFSRFEVRSGGHRGD